MIYLSLWCENRVTRYGRSEFIYLLLLRRTGNLGTQVAIETVAAIVIVIIVVLVVVVVTPRHCRRCGCCFWWFCCYGFGFRINREKDSRQNNIYVHISNNKLWTNTLILFRVYNVRKIRLAILNTQVESKAVIIGSSSEPMYCKHSQSSLFVMHCGLPTDPIGHASTYCTQPQLMLAMSGTHVTCHHK